ncbi:hypothetical protein N7499_006655 [Penicillium canescens]|nr:hypothetical protein N7499_006655 [Penicillium canescens]
MSPKTHRAHAPRADNIGQSNTTASLFLGGVRRNWMGPEGSGQIRARQPSNVDIPTGSQPPRAEPLMSPATGDTLPFPRSGFTAVNAKKPDPPRVTAFPSPVPSTNSHPSPVGSDGIVHPPTGQQTQRGNEEHMAATLPTVGVSRPQSRTQNPVVGAQRAANPHGTPTTGPGSDGQRGSGQGTPSTLPSDEYFQPRPLSPLVEAQRDTNPHGTQTTGSSANRQRGNEEQDTSALPPNGPAQGQSTAQSPLVGAQRDTNPQATQQPSGPSPGGHPQDAGPSLVNPVPDDGQWELWSTQLDTLVSELNQKKVLTANVGLPRVDLLRQAIQKKTPFIWRIDPTTLGFLGAPEAGIRMLARLLEDNEKMDYAVTFGFSHFPASPQTLISQPWYYKAVAKVPLFLKRLAGEWEGIYTWALRPPLVDELRTKFTVDSPVLMAVMFMCISRGLYEEQYIKKLLQLFWNDWASYTGLLDGRVTETSRRTLRQHLNREYLKFPKLHAPSQSPQVAQVDQSQSPQVVQSPQVAQSPQVTQATQVHYPNSPHPKLLGQTMPQTVPVSSPYVGYPASSQPPASSAGAGEYYHSASNSPQVQSSPSTGYLYPPGRQPQLHEIQTQAARREQLHPSQMPHAMTQGMGAFAQAPVQIPRAPVPLTHPSPLSFSAAPSQPFRPSITINSAHPQIASQPHLQHRQLPLPSAPITPAQTLQRDPSISYFLPTPDYRAPMTVNPNPMRLGLHQANLRDPIKKLLTKGTDGQEIETNLSCYLAGCAIPTTIISPQVPMYEWNFDVPETFYQTFPHMTPQNPGQRPIWTYRPGCNTLRLRSIRLPGNPTSGAEQWPNESTYWPSVLYIHVNDQEMFVRRKVHNGKDLPLDITANIRPGRNTIKITLLLGQDECKNSRYAMGVEILRISDFEQLKSMARPIPAADSRALIQKRLTPTLDDDDLAVVTDNLTISLVDPFMARIFDIPARSRNCTHFDCFDLDTFIKTRMFKSDEKPMIENWRCPTCKKDARPQFLVIDQFLADVHANLARTNRLDRAQAIQFKADGSWTLREVSDEPSSPADRARLATKRKADSMENPQGQGGPRPKIGVSPPVTQASVMQDHTVIELD